MKKREGFIRYRFDDGTLVDMPVRADLEGMPASGGGWGESHKWRWDYDTSDASRRDWWRVQDALDEHVSMSLAGHARNQKRGKADRRRDLIVAYCQKTYGQRRTRISASIAAEFIHQKWDEIVRASEFEGDKPLKSSTIARYIREARKNAE